MKRSNETQLRFILNHLHFPSFYSFTLLSAVKVDSQTDYTKLRVKELKAILAERGVECTGCLEKPDFIKKCEETAHLSSEF